jgi:ribosomal protein L3 glutamine methyltransferase
MTLSDAIRRAASRLKGSGVLVAHHADNALDEARTLVLHALHLPNSWPAGLAAAQLSAVERDQIDALIDRRIAERVPAAYLVGHAEFAGLEFLCDQRALVPRSPIAELIESGFAGWIDPDRVHYALDLCCGGGSIGIAMAVHRPRWRVDLVDLSSDALALAADNIARHRVSDRVRTIQSDLFSALGGERYDLIVSNPPYVTEAEFAALAPEYGHEPALGLVSGHDGLDATARILAHAADHLRPGGLLIVEIGEAWRAFERRFAHLPVAWIHFSVGHMGVFAITREALLASRSS